MTLIITNLNIFQLNCLLLKSCGLIEIIEEVCLSEIKIYSSKSEKENTYSKSCETCDKKRPLRAVEIELQPR